MRRFRLLNKLYANMFGYFWAACPICKTMFGGHEYAGTLWSDYENGKLTCFGCPGDHGETPSLQIGMKKPSSDTASSKETE